MLVVVEGEKPFLVDVKTQAKEENEKKKNLLLLLLLLLLKKNRKRKKKTGEKIYKNGEIAVRLRTVLQGSSVQR